MKKLAHYVAMEESCRRHAQLDKTTAERWLEEAELWSKLMKVEHRLQLLGTTRRSRAATQHRRSKKPNDMCGSDQTAT
jgi:hypothetical protein